MTRSRPSAIITGGSRGIGAATAMALAARGYALTLGSRHPEECEPVARRVRELGGEACAVRVDVAQYEEAQNLIDAALRTYGEVNALINNAGTMDPVARITECDPSAWAKSISINLTGAFHCIRAALPSLYTTHNAVIVNLSTGAAAKPLSGWSAYCAGKAGLMMLTRILAEEVAGTPIRVYGLRPGMVNTRMSREALKIKVNPVSELDPSGFPDPEVPAQAIAWLCAERPADLQGQEPDLLDPVFRQRVGLPAD